MEKLDGLKKLGDPIEERHKEHTERGSVIDQLTLYIYSYRETAMSNDLMFDHIDLEDRQKVSNECVEAEAWLREKKQQQESLPKHVTPVLLSADVKKKAEAIDRPIMMKPKPVVPKKPASPELPPAAAPQGSESADYSNTNPNENAGAAHGEVPPAATKPMETDKSETAPCAA